MKITRKEVLIIQFEVAWNLPSFFLEEIGKITKNLRKNSRSPSRCLNVEPPEYTARVLPLDRDMEAAELHRELFITHSSLSTEVERRLKSSGMLHRVEWQIVTEVLKEYKTFIFRVNSGNYVPNDTGSHPKRLEASKIPPWEPQISRK